MVLCAQLFSVALGALQLGVQLSFDLQRNAVTLPVQESSSLGLETPQVLVQSRRILRLSHSQTWEMQDVQLCVRLSVSRWTDDETTD